MNEILTLLDKVNRQSQILVHLPNMARIDVDLLLAEIRQVYDKTLDLQLMIETSRLEPKTEPRSKLPTPASFETNTQLSEQTAPKVDEPLLFQEPEEEKPVHPKAYEYTPPLPRIITPQETPSSSFEIPAQKPVVSPIASPIIKPAVNPVVSPVTKTTVNSGVNPASALLPKSLHQAYEEQSSDHSIAARLQYNPINDLRSAIGINDKFLLMNQLFKGSLEQYNAAIERLNNYYNYDDAEIFLGSLKILHDWADDLPAIEKLQHFVKRRYQKE